MAHEQVRWTGTMTELKRHCKTATHTSPMIRLGSKNKKTSSPLQSAGFNHPCGGWGCTSLLTAKASLANVS
jgi:hypothetical protein